MYQSNLKSPGLILHFNDIFNYVIPRCDWLHAGLLPGRHPAGDVRCACVPFTPGSESYSIRLAKKNFVFTDIHSDGKVSTFVSSLVVMSDY